MRVGGRVEEGVCGRRGPTILGAEGPGRSGDDEAIAQGCRSLPVRTALRGDGADPGQGCGRGRQGAQQEAQQKWGEAQGEPGDGHWGSGCNVYSDRVQYLRSGGKWAMAGGWGRMARTGKEREFRCFGNLRSGFDKFRAGSGKSRRDTGGGESQRGGGWSANRCMCSLCRADVFSFEGNVSSFRPNVSTLAGQVSSEERAREGK